MENNAFDSKHQLFLRQKDLLDTFLEHHAITQEQYDKSIGDLMEKMGEKGNASRKAGS